MTAPDTTSSWWLGVTPAEFARQLPDEQARMRRENESTAIFADFVDKAPQSAQARRPTW